jgi:hypothetical protein
MELLTNLNGGAKVVLKVKFQGTGGVYMELVSINKDYVKKEKSNDYKYFKNDIYDFVLWSTQDFIFDNRQLRFPDEKNVKQLMSHTHKFGSDKERYATLKKLYNTLEYWSRSMDITQGVLSTKTKRVILAGDYWFVS